MNGNLSKNMEMLNDGWKWDSMMLIGDQVEFLVSEDWQKSQGAKGLSHQTFEMSKNSYATYVFLIFLCYCEWFVGFNENSLCYRNFLVFL